MSSTLSETSTTGLTESASTRPRPVLARLLALLGVPDVRWAVVAVVLFAVGGLAQLTGAPVPVWWGFYLACYATGGWDPGLAGVQALREKTLDVDLLMIVAAVVAASIGQVFDGALLIVIFATSGALEAVATKRTADSVRALLDIAPEEATRFSDDGEEHVVATSELVVGDVVVIRPGERIGADAEVVAGASEVDQASITGEPLPVLKQLGDEVFAGTLNTTGALQVRVHRPAEESVIARIVALVEEASATKAATQLFIEKVEQRYSIGMVTATLALFFIPLAFGAALAPTLLRAITFMIVASPCAVVLATMPPLLSAIATAGRHGVLVKSAVVMEQLGLTDTVAFDKTGTLTEGTPRVSEVWTVGDGQLSEDQLLGLAAAAERPSEHPLAAAIVSAAHDRQLPLDAAEDFASAPGRGVTARIQGRTVRVGSPALLEELPPAVDDTLLRAHAQALITAAEARGATAVVVLIDGFPAGVLALADRVRAGAGEAVSALDALTGRTPVLLVGGWGMARAHRRDHHRPGRHPPPDSAKPDRSPSGEEPGSLPEAQRNGRFQRTGDVPHCPAATCRCKAAARRDAIPVCRGSLEVGRRGPCYERVGKPQVAASRYGVEPLAAGGQVGDDEAGGHPAGA